MEAVWNRRGSKEHFWRSQHLRLNDLKEKAKAAGLRSDYLFKDNIPESPRPEFHVSHVKHDTDEEGLRGIRTDNGFKDPMMETSSEFRLLWWSLSVGPNEIKSAERRLLEKTYPDQKDLLEKFTTSPAFKKISRLGPYRFTFPLEDLLEAYREQFCSGAKPVMRVFKTVLYKQEVNYVVLVHSPDQEHQFSDYPLLTDNPDAVCTYRDGCFIWRPEARSGTHGYELIVGPDQMEAQELFGRDVQYYVWDNVSIALHVENKQVLNFAGRLRDNLKSCRREILTKDGVTYEDFPTEELVNELWPDHPSPLEKDE